ncbi:MAG: hypothetical protein Q8R20_01455 [Nanoarchaeota archaeon]|nr:hypothetical protein [Nanoarchaeota archaeon]
MKKKPSETKIIEKLRENEEEFLEIVKKEWDVLQKNAKKEKLVAQGKEAALVTTKVLFAVLAVAGICTVALVAPKVFTMYGMSSRRKTYVNKKGTLEKLHYMKRRGYVDLEKLDKMKYKVKLTEKGRAKMLLTLFDGMGKEIKKDWDGVWRIVAFDIPETRKQERDGFRKKLRDIGFHTLQQSVFICPYACKKELEFIMSVFDIERFVKIIEVKHISEEGELWKAFGM